MEIVGVPVRVYDTEGYELGIAYVPPLVLVGDLLTIDGAPYEIFALIDTAEPPFAASVRVSPILLSA